MSALMETYARLPVTFSYGDGAYLFDTDGRRYLDGIAGIGVNALGHAHPAVTAAINSQAAKLIHTSNLYRIEAQEQLAERLAGVAGMDACFFGNSGAEANEAAIKLARLYGHHKGIQKPTIVVLILCKYIIYLPFVIYIIMLFPDTILSKGFIFLTYI